MKVVFSTNIPSPYRVDFFNELGKYCELTVLYERSSSAERDASWKGDKAQTFTEIYLPLTPVGVDRSKGHALKKYIAANEFDILILTNYVSPATMEAIAYCRSHKVPYCIEYDGGFNKKDRFPKNLLKKYLLCGAKAHFTTCEEHKKYLLGLGIPTEKIFKYPFTSLRQSDLERAKEIISIPKSEYRQKLGMTEEKILLSVGRFSYQGGYGKGYDVLLKVAEQLGKDVGVYIVGDEPTEEFVRLKEEHDLTQVHYIGFKNKADLAEYYAAADAFILLTRGDIWGLVINEAMSFGLPIITTPMCIAGTELVRREINGIMVEIDAQDELVNNIRMLLKKDDISNRLGIGSSQIIQDYTIEKMAEMQFRIFRNLKGE